MILTFRLLAIRFDRPNQFRIGFGLCVPSISSSRTIWTQSMANKLVEQTLPVRLANLWTMVLTLGQPFSFLFPFTQCLDELKCLALQSASFSLSGAFSSPFTRHIGKSITQAFCICLGVTTWRIWCWPLCTWSLTFKHTQFGNIHFQSSAVRPAKHLNLFPTVSLFFYKAYLFQYVSFLSGVFYVLPDTDHF